MIRVRNELFLKWRNHSQKDQYIHLKEVFKDYVNMTNMVVTEDNYESALKYIDDVLSFQKIYSTQVASVIMVNAIYIARG